MRVRVHLTIDGEKETILDGDSPIFGNGVDYRKGYDSRLGDIGFWLCDWRYTGHSGPNNKRSRIFVPWSSALYIEELA